MQTAFIVSNESFMSLIVSRASLHFVAEPETNTFFIVGIVSLKMDPHHFNFHLNHTQAMMNHPPPPTSSPPQSVPGRRYDDESFKEFRVSLHLKG